MSVITFFCFKGANCYGIGNPEMVYSSIYTTSHAWLDPPPHFIPLHLFIRSKSVHTSVSLSEAPIPKNSATERRRDRLSVFANPFSTSFSVLPSLKKLTTDCRRLLGGSPSAVSFVPSTRKNQKGETSGAVSDSSPTGKNGIPKNILIKVK